MSACQYPTKLSCRQNSVSDTRRKNLTEDKLSKRLAGSHDNDDSHELTDSISNSEGKQKQQPQLLQVQEFMN